MFELSVKINLPFNNAWSHAEVKVHCLTTHETYIVSYSPDHKVPGTKNKRKINFFNQEQKLGETSTNCFRPRCVTLYSPLELSLDTFIKTIEEKFHRGCIGFNICCNNCADAVKFTLEYFFSAHVFSKAHDIAHIHKVKNKMLAYKSLTFLCCFASGGTLPFFCAPPFFNAPIDVFKEAELLAEHFGRQADVTQALLAREPEPMCMV